jgi:MacB-like periplasmic core domain
VTTTRLTHAMRMGLRSLGAHRLRSVLTALGIILGVASVIVMLAVGEAARAEAPCGTNKALRATASWQGCQVWGCELAPLK